MNNWIDKIRDTISWWFGTGLEIFFPDPPGAPGVVPREKVERPRDWPDKDEEEMKKIFDGE